MKRWIPAALLVVAVPLHVLAANYYVRQTVGNDGNDGTSAATAWQSIERLSSAMQAGDTAYVGPGLYREGVTVENGGTVENRLIFVADATGQHTGDPPGAVVVTGAQPVDESIFQPAPARGVYKAHFPDYTPLGVVEMDGPEPRYARAINTTEYLVGKQPPVDVVTKLPSTFFYDEVAADLWIHTSDGAPPTTHEIEIIRRGNGIYIEGKHYVTVLGFTFRHMGDAGISFFKGSGDGIAVDNTSYGSRQGIRVYGAPNVQVYGNTLFRNENSGVYFAAGSVNGLAIRNVSYENTKGIRWSSQSSNGVAVDNVLFDNHERGISIEEVSHVLLRNNVAVNNSASQLMVYQSEYSSEDNCFANGGPEQFVADDFPLIHYRTLAEYQRARTQDLHSREGCGVPPAKVDVRKVHAESMAYTARARKMLRGETEAATGAGDGKPPAAAPPEGRPGRLVRR